MTRLRYLPLLLLLLAAPAGAAPEAQGIFFGWGAFRGGGRCWAVAEPEGSARGGRSQPYLMLSWIPAKRVRGQVAIRFARPKRPGSAVLLHVDERTFLLVGGGANAWAPDARADGAIVAAMRTGVVLSVETRSETGGAMRDVYRLRGAASAVDAAAIACAR
jgi:hypothetical protein